MAALPATASTGNTRAMDNAMTDIADLICASEQRCRQTFTGEWKLACWCRRDSAVRLSPAPVSLAVCGKRHGQRNQ